MRILTLSFILVLYSTLSFATGNNRSFLSPKKTQQAARPNVPGDLVLDFGLSLLNDQPDVMDLRALGSRAVNIYYMAHIKFGTDSHFSFNPGFGFGIDNFMFDQNVTLTRIPNEEGVENVQIVELSDILGEDVEIKKSKLTVGYLDIPLELRFHLNENNHDRGFKLAVGGRVGVRFDAHTKIKYESLGDNKKLKEKEKFELNPFRYGIHGRMGFGSFNVFYYQNLSTLFQKDDGPEQTEAKSFMAGISFTLF